MATLRILAPTLLVAALVAGCGDGRLPPAPLITPDSVPSSTPGQAQGSTTSSSPEATTTYVALGDSYTAAPGLPTTDPASGSCSRSSHDYPHVVAAADPTLQLDDVSCSGATTDDVLNTQLASVHSDTDVVTVGIGGNDEALFTTVVGGCIQAAASDPTGTPCTDRLGDTVKADLVKVRTNVDSVLAAIRAKAPQARIIVVGYPQVLPSDGTSCADLVPIAAGDYPFVNAMNAGLSDDLRGAAKAAGADFVDVYGPSKGHDICSADPWINGIQTAANGVIPFHPFAGEQRAVAGRIAQLLS